MFDVFKSVKDLLKISNVFTDSVWFRLHYKITAAILIGISVIITGKQYLGDPIDCIVKGVSQDLMDTYCWIHSTFTLPEKLTAEIGSEVPHAGIANPYSEERRYHTYYQWVCFFTFFQGITFYIPRLIWRSVDGGKIKMLLLEMTNPLIEEKTKQDRRKLICDYLFYHANTHNAYAWKYVFCEVLNLINVIVQIFLTDWFVGGEFMSYGSDVVKFSREDSSNRTDPMATIFPKVTKCTFHKYGPSGTVMKIDGICVLPVNVVNEKVMIFLWFWFVLLSICTAIGVILCFLYGFSCGVRKYVLKRKSGTVDPEIIEHLCDTCQFGDWFLLYQLARNMDPIAYKEMISDLNDRLTKGEDRWGKKDLKSA